MLHIHPPKIDSLSSFFRLVLVTHFRLTIKRPENHSEYNSKTWNSWRISVYILKKLCLYCFQIKNSRIIILTSYKLKMFNYQRVSSIYKCFVNSAIVVLPEVCVAVTSPPARESWTPRLTVGATVTKRTLTSYHSPSEVRKYSLCKTNYFWA